MDAQDVRARLRAYIADRWPPEPVFVPPPPDTRPLDFADPLDRPGPQPWNAGVTPGWPPEELAVPPPELVAAVGELAHATRVAERVGAAARRADKGNWEVARWVAELERQVEIMGRELESLRGASERDAGAGEGRPGGGPAAAAGPRAEAAGRR